MGDEGEKIEIDISVSTSNRARATTFFWISVQQYAHVACTAALEGFRRWVYGIRQQSSPLLQALKKTAMQAM